MATGSFQDWWAKTNFNAAQRLRIYRKIATMTRYGLPLQRVLEMLYEQASKNGKRPNDPMAIILSTWRTAIRNGRPLSAAAGPWIPYGERMMIEAGEESKSLSDSLENLILINQGTSQMRSAIIGGISYPIMLIFMLCGLLWLFGIRVIPAFATVLPTEKWVGAAHNMAVMSAWVQNWMIPTILGIVASFMLIGWSMPRWTGPIRTRFDKIPPWSLYRLVSGAAFLLSLGALISAGVQASRALEKIKKNSSPWLRERMEATLRHVYSGSNVGRALQRSGYDYPDVEMIEDLVAYADLPAFTEMLDLLGREWLQQSVTKIQSQARILNTIALIMMAGTVAFVFSGIFAIQQQITSSVSGGGI